eukprot:9025008-Pyramimonas_sp.AAC.1
MAFWCLLGRPWGALARSWGPLGALLGPSRGSLVPFWGHFEASEARQKRNGPNASIRDIA